MERSTVYRIRVRGRLDVRWEPWLGDMALSAGSDETALIGALPDQAALHGVLARIRDLGLELVSLETVGPDGIGPQEGKA